MGPNRDILEELHEADCSGQIAIMRHICEEILSEFPNHGPTLIRYASCLIDLCLYDKAKIVLDRAEKIVPRKRQHLVMAQRGHLLQSTGDLEGAENQFLLAHQLVADDATYLIYAGSAAFNQGNLTRAEEHARLATQCSDGCLDEAYFNLGGYLLAQNRYDEARPCYLKALEIDPEYEISKTRLDDLDNLLRRLQ